MNQKKSQTAFMPVLQKRNYDKRNKNNQLYWWIREPIFGACQRDEAEKWIYFLITNESQKELINAWLEVCNMEFSSIEGIRQRDATGFAEKLHL